MDNHKYKGKIAFYQDTSWYHRIKRMKPDGSIEYTKMGGFSTPEEAEKSYYEYLKKFEDERRNSLAPRVNKDIMFKDYLIYWMESVYKNRVASTTAMAASYIIYELIMPSISYDIKLKLITAEYLNELLEQILPLGKSSASESRKILYLAFKDAVADDYIQSNVVSNAKKYYRQSKPIVILQKEELKKFLSLVSKDGWYLEILLALFCGLEKVRF